MHISVPNIEEAREKEKFDRLHRLAEAILGVAGKTYLTWTKFKNGVSQVDGLEDSGARKKFEQMIHHGVVKKAEFGRYS
jgi:hypothetical protein